MPLATTVLCLAAVGLSSCCFDAPLTCNLRELASPPDARVAMVDHMFPRRNLRTSDEFGALLSTGTWCGFTYPDLYQLNGIYYRKRTIQYARAHRPIIRGVDDAAFSNPLTREETQEQFTIDSTIPEEVWMQPVNVTDKDMEFNQLVCIPARQFDFARARKVVSPVPCPSPLCDLPIKDKPGTPSAWLQLAEVPLVAVDAVATATLRVAEGVVFVGAAAILLPAYPFICFYQQQQDPLLQLLEVKDDEIPCWKK